MDYRLYVHLRDSSYKDELLGLAAAAGLQVNRLNERYLDFVVPGTTRKQILDAGRGFLTQLQTLDYILIATLEDRDSLNQMSRNPNHLWVGMNAAIDFATFDFRKSVSEKRRKSPPFRVGDSCFSGFSLN